MKNDNLTVTYIPKSENIIVHKLPYSGNFRQAEILAIFAIKHKLAKNLFSQKFVLAKISSSKNFLRATSRAQFLRAADPVNRQKIDLFVVEESSKLQRASNKLFVTYDQLGCRNRNCELILVLAPSIWQGSFSPVSCENLWGCGHTP